MSNESFAAAADLARQAAFVEANKAKACVRCDARFRIVEVVGDDGELKEEKIPLELDKKGLCPACQAKRLASMKLDPDREEESRQMKDTIYTLLSGPGGHAQVQGMDLNYCNSAVTARANLQSTINSLGKYESHLIAYPNSVAAWDNYSRMYDRIDDCVRQIKHFEGLLQKNWPNLKIFPIQVPIKLERAEERGWLEV